MNDYIEDFDDAYVSVPPKSVTKGMLLTMKAYTELIQALKPFAEFHDALKESNRAFYVIDIKAGPSLTIEHLREASAIFAKHKD